MSSLPPLQPDADFAAALEAERARLRAFAVGLCARDLHLAEDVVQEALARAWRYRASFSSQRAPDEGRDRPRDASREVQDGLSLGPWLRRIAFRCFCDLREQRLPHRSLDEDAPAREAPIAQLRDELDWALGGLSERERDIVLRFHGRRESVREIATGLGMAEGTVKSHLHRARRKMAGRRT
jgi:RNA polymerase sigma-70 factor (ECF subfamily)